MSKIDVGPLAGYNSLTDRHLAGYFNNTRMRKHLIKSGLITRQGEVVPESVFRLNTSRKDHRRNVRDLLAQAIVHKTLDMERSRQVSIRRKLEEIAKIELVRRVRAERHRKGDEDILPLMSGRVRRPKRSPNRLQSADSHSDIEHGAGIDPIYVDADGMPLSPDAESRARLLKKFPDEEIDSKHLYALDSVALREYAKVLERYDRGRVAKSPYLMSQIPRPPTSGGPSSSRRPMTAGPASGRMSRSTSAKKQGSLVLHRTEPALMNQNRLQSMCEVEMRYFGQQVFTGREDVDPAQEVMVEQQHCGGNTLTVFRRKILPGTSFSFCSRRHRGYPFSLTFFINGVKDSRLSACCEYRHSQGARLGGKQGHFGIVRVKGAAPCYKCQVERGSIPVESSSKPKRASKSKPAPFESSEEYKDDFEDEADKAASEEEKTDSPKPGDGSSKSSSKASSKSSSAASSPRQTAGIEDAVASKQDSESDQHEEEIVGRPVGFSDKEDEEEAKARSSSSSSSSSSSRSSSPKVDKKLDATEGGDVAIESDSEETGAPKVSSLVEHPTVTVPVEDDDEEEDARKDETDAERKDETEDPEKEEVKEETDEEVVPEAKTVTLSIITGDELGAGTNARIFCRLIGTEGTSEVVEVGDADDSERRFERGSVDSFRLSVNGLKGRPKQLEVWHNGSGLGATWLLDKILLLVDGEEFEFVFRNWIEGDQGEGLHHQIIDVSPATVAAEKDEALIKAIETEEPLLARDHSSQSSSESSSDEAEEAKAVPTSPVESSSSPSSSSDEEEEDKGGASESGPDGGFDPDASLNATDRPVLADAVDQAETFRPDGDVREFVKPVAPDDPDNDAYTVEVINTSLDVPQLTRLANVMKEHTIECLNIRNGRIDDEKLQIILDVLEHKDELKLLNLNCNNIGPKGASLIAKRLSRWTRLELLLLHGNPLLDDGINEIVTAIINRNQRAKDAGIVTGPLRSLDLGDSEMTNQGAYVVSQFMEENVPLESLELTGNRKIGLDGWRQIGNALGTNRCLRTLSVDYCSLRDDQLSALISRLSSNTTLLSLDLEGNELTDVGAQQLREMLVENGSLCDVSLRPGNTEINDDLCEEIVEMAARNSDD